MKDDHLPLPSRSYDDTLDECVTIETDSDFDCAEFFAQTSTKNTQEKRTSPLKSAGPKQHSLNFE